MAGVGGQASDFFIAREVLRFGIHENGHIALKGRFYGRFNDVGGKQAFAIVGKYQGLGAGFQLRVHGAEDALPAAQELARSYHCIVSVSGETDLVTDGTAVIRVANGDPRRSGICDQQSGLSGKSPQPGQPISRRPLRD